MYDDFMTLGNFNTLFYTLAFVVPGFILNSTISMLVPQRTDQTQVVLLRFLSLSFINYGFWSWLVYLIFRSPYFTDRVVLTALSWFFIIFAGPVVFGLIVGRFSETGVFRTILQRLGFKPIHVIPTAWDYKFSKTSTKAWVLVTLSDGQTVAGLYGHSSFASSQFGERDIYLERVYKVSNGSSWQEVNRTDGILLKEGSIKHIEFFK